MKILEWIKNLFNRDKVSTLQYPISTRRLSDLSDVDVRKPEEGDALIYGKNRKWIAGDGGGGGGGKDSVTLYPKNSTDNIIQPTNDIIPLTVQGAVDQTENMQEWVDSDGNKLIAISNDGSLLFGEDESDGTWKISRHNNNLVVERYNDTNKWESKLNVTQEIDTGWSVENIKETKEIDCETADIEDVADTLGTLIEALKDRKIIDA